MNPDPDQLAAHAQHLASIIESSADAIVGIDLEGVITTWNPSAEQVYGIAATTALGSCLYDLVSPSLAAATRANVERIRIGETFKLPDVQWPGRDGRPVHLAVTLSPIRNAGGQVVGVASFGRNITLRKRTEQALRVAASKYAILFEVAPVAISIGDANGHLVEGNSAAEHILGLPAAEQQRRTFDDPKWQVIRPDGTPMPPEEFASVRAAVEHRRIDGVELGIIRPEGDVRWVMVNAAPLDLPGYGIIATYVDITARKEMEDALRDSEERLRLVIENSPDAIALFNDGARLFFVSAGVHRLTGWDNERIFAEEATALECAAAAEAKAPPPAGTTASTTWRAIHAAVKDCLADLGAQRSVAFAMHTEQGELRQVHAHFQGYCRRNGAHEVVCVVHDITEHVALHEMMEATNHALEARVAERTAALETAVSALERANAGKDAFLAAVSHELRTPLAGILTAVEVLQTQVRGPLNDYQLRYAATIEMSAQRLQGMIDSILAYTRAMTADNAVHLGVCNLADLVTQAAHGIEARANRKQIAVDCGAGSADEHAHNGFAIAGDCEAILRMLDALLDNAVKFTPAGGQVGIEIIPLPASGAVELTVWDTGIGIEPAHVQELFHPFTQADQRLARRFEGLGLGLAYVKRRVDLLDGTIRIEPNQPAGTRVIVTLPRA